MTDLDAAIERSLAVACPRIPAIYGDLGRVGLGLITCNGMMPPETAANRDVMSDPPDGIR